MRVVSLNGGFGFENLRLEERPEPSCGPRQIVIRVRAVSLNARDLMMVRGTYNPRQKLPLIPCSDASGEVVERGTEVSEWELGAAVCPIFASAWQAGALTREAQRSTLGGPLDGTLREYLVADAAAVVRAPSHLTALEAACLPCTYVTAQRALVELGKITAQQWLVCLGTGGVSLAALSLAKAHGARVILVSRSAAKLERALALGADHGIDSSATPAWSKTVRELTEQRGADHVLEVGGAQTMEHSIRSLCLGGTLSLIGVLSGNTADIDLRPILMQDLRIQGVFVGSRQSFESMLSSVEQHALRPQIDRTFGLEDVRAAFEYAASGQQFGKVTIKLD